MFNSLINLVIKIFKSYFGLQDQGFNINYYNIGMIISNELLLGIYIYLVGVAVLLFQWKHILNILLRFEILMLGVIFSFLLTWGLNRREFNIIMIIIVFGVCEARLGLSILVRLIRVHGNDYVNSLIIYKL